MSLSSSCWNFLSSLFSWVKYFYFCLTLWDSVLISFLNWFFIFVVDSIVSLPFFPSSCPTRGLPHAVVLLIKDQKVEEHKQWGVQPRCQLRLLVSGVRLLATMSPQPFFMWHSLQVSCSLLLFRYICVCHYLWYINTDKRSSVLQGSLAFSRTAWGWATNMHTW